MKQFFKFMLASMAALFVSGFILFLFFMVLISSMATEKEVGVKDHSILEISLSTEIKERSSKNPLEGFSFADLSNEKSIGLNDILASINSAAGDPQIDGIYLNLRNASGSMATLEEIRNALLDFKKSKKFIYAYSEGYSQRAYYLASLADKIYLYPEGEVDFHGLNANLMFFKGTLEKLEIEPEIIRHGKFKSAVEPFMYDKMSPENKEQTKVFIGSLWNQYLTDIAASRGTSVEELQKTADNLSGRNGKLALESKLVDQLAYYDEVIDILKQKTGISENESLNFIDLKKYSKTITRTKDFLAPKIAIIYANGDIVSGKSDDDQMGSTTIAEAIRKARKDSTIKAIVLRVNSPGGSALASDVIWRETILARKAKPLVVSMGDYAASGGYYISCAANKIVAQPNTITGSIGVFGLLFNTQKMFNNKLGITFDTVKTARMAGLGDMNYPLTAEERAIMQESVEDIYGTFIQHVADGRKMLVSEVDSIGQGRVWSGTDAKQLGLVDELGGIDRAIEIAAQLAKLDKHREIEMPEQKEFFDKLFEDLNAEASTKTLKTQLGPLYNDYVRVKAALENQGVQARIPYSLDIR